MGAIAERAVLRTCIGSAGKTLWAKLAWFGKDRRIIVSFPHTYANQPARRNAVPSHVHVAGDFTIDELTLVEPHRFLHDLRGEVGGIGRGDLKIPEHLRVSE